MSKPEQERLTAVLKDTIGLLCKNSLTFDKQMVIQGLVAITIDTEDVMVVQINESLGQASSAPCVTCGLSKQSPAPDEPVLASIPRKRRRSHSRSNDLPSKSWRSTGASVHSDGSHLSVEDEETASVVKAEKESDDEDLIFVDSEMKKEASDVFYDRGNDSSHVDSSYITGYLDNSEISQVTTSSQMNSPLQWQHSSTEQPLHPPPQVENQMAEFELMCKQIVEGKASIQAFYPNFTCGFCKELFPHGKAVKEHAATVHGHANYEPYCCPWPSCQRLFSFSGSVTRHLRLHLDSRPLKCPCCSYCCRNHSSLKWHMKSVHGQTSQTGDVLGLMKSTRQSQGELWLSQPESVMTQGELSQGELSQGESKLSQCESKLSQGELSQCESKLSQGESKLSQGESKLSQCESKMSQDELSQGESKLSQADFYLSQEEFHPPI